VQPEAEPERPETEGSPASRHTARGFPVEPAAAPRFARTVLQSALFVDLL